MVRLTRTVWPALLVLLAPFLTPPAPGQAPPGAAGDAATRPQPEAQDADLRGVAKVRHGLREIGEGSQEVTDDLTSALRRRWLEDGKVQAVVVQADGDVDNFMRDSIQSRIDTARNLGAEVVILQIDTYGGLVTAGLEISRFIKQQDDLFILCYVDEKAISAGAMIAMACDAIAMEPASQIGDSGVIAIGAGGVEGMDETTRAKSESPVLADFADSARRNGYSTLLAESFVRVDREVYFIENTATGEHRFVDAADYQRLVEGGPFGAEDSDWQVPSDVPAPLDDARSLLTLSDTQAQRIGLSIGTYPSAQALAEARGWNITTTLAPSAGEKMVGFLSGYAVRGALMAVLFLAVYMSLSHPGTGLPEVTAVICLAVLFGVPMLTGFAQWYEVAFVLVGILLLAVELFVLPGFGVAGISGVVLIFLGLALTFVAPLAPAGLPAGFGVDWSDFAYGLLTVVLGLTASLLLWAWLGRYLPRLPIANRLILRDEVLDPRAAAERAARSAAWPAPGSIGWAVSDLRPGGTAKFAITPDPEDTANADVVSDRGFIAAGTRLAVVDVAGNRVVVRPAGGSDE